MKLTIFITIGALTLLGGCNRSPEQPLVSQVQPAPGPDTRTPENPGGPGTPTPLPAPRVASGPSTSAARPTSEPIRDPEDEVEQRAMPTLPVYSDYRPSLAQPRPIAAPWAPPPLLGDAIPPQPSPDAWWTGGYWVWRQQWVWAPGRWARPPRPDYRWMPPYYEHRDDRVIFVDGFWSAPGVAFVRPAATRSIASAAVGAGVATGRPPVGPEGPFVPSPPGSRQGLIVPAPIGTPPSVVRGAPAIVAPGMRITQDDDNSVHDTVIDRNTTIHRDTTIDRHDTIANRITHVTIEAPASATVDHRAVHDAVAPRMQLAAGMQAIPQSAPPVVAPSVVAPSPKVATEPAPGRPPVHDERSPAAAPSSAQREGSRHPDDASTGTAQSARPEARREPGTTPAARPVAPAVETRERMGRPTPAAPVRPATGAVPAHAGHASRDPSHPHEATGAPRQASSRPGPSQPASTKAPAPRDAHPNDRPRPVGQAAPPAQAGAHGPATNAQRHPAGAPARDAAEKKLEDRRE